MQKPMSNATTVKVAPIDKASIEALRNSAPTLYRDIVERYGEQAVKNNFLVRYQLLTEGKDVLTKNGSKVTITPELIHAVYQASKAKWTDYVKKAMRGDYRLKSKYQQYPSDEFGYIPLMTNHKPTIENKHGWLVSESLAVEVIDGNTCLTGNCLLVSPESKYNHLTKNWFEVSPTFVNNAINEVSYIPHGAQLDNTSFSQPNNPDQELYNTNIENFDIIAEIKKLKTLSEEQERLNEEIARNTKINRTVDKLVADKIICTGQIEQVKNVMSFSAPDEIVVKTLQIANSSFNPYANQPKILNVKGNINMAKTKDQVYLEWMEQNPQHKDKSLSAVTAEFETYYSGLNASFSAPDVTLEDPKANLLKAIDAAKAAGLDIGSINASFSTPEIATTTATQAVEKPANQYDKLLQDTLEKGIQATTTENEKLKQELAAAQARNTELENGLSNLVNKK
jgi:hypothetical protein